MKEDKSDKWIASSLKKYQEEGQLPYDIGAWEGFQKIRIAKKRRAISYWAGAVAASLLLLFGISQVMRMDYSDAVLETGTSELLTDHDSPEKEQTPISSQKELISEHDGQMAKETTKVNPEKIAPQQDPNLKSKDKSEAPAIRKNELLAEKEVEKPSKAEPELNTTLKESKESPLIAKVEEAETKKEEGIGKVNSGQIGNISSEELQTSKTEQVPPLKTGTTNPTIASLDQNSADKKDPNASITIAEPKKVENLTALVEEKDFPEIPKDQTKVVFGMGVSPGFGSVEQNDMNTMASSIGVGMLLDIDLPGKLTVGSGFGLNYMNQQNETQMPVTVAGYRTSQIEKQDIQQVQVEMPIYIKYPLTRNQSISIQAGFSNLYAINQNGEQSTTINEQVAVNNSFDALSNSSSFAIQNKAVTQSRELTNPDSKFYPFATVNLGVNIRLLETKKLNYMVMPFYNHQLRSISGFGNNFGMFGASLKLNFGGTDEN